MTCEDNRALVCRWIAAVDAQEFDALDGFLGPEVMAHLPGGAVLDRDGIRAFESAFAAAFPDVHRRIDDLIAEGDKVVMRETVLGTHEGEFSGVPATGRGISFTAIVIYRIRDRKIVETWDEADFAGLMKQITDAR